LRAHGILITIGGKVNREWGRVVQQWRCTTILVMPWHGLCREEQRRNAQCGWPPTPLYPYASRITPRYILIPTPFPPATLHRNCGPGPQSRGFRFCCGRCAGKRHTRCASNTVTTRWCGTATYSGALFSAAMFSSAWVPCEESRGVSLARLRDENAYVSAAMVLRQMGI